MSWRPHSMPGVAVARARMEAAVRGYFVARDVLEVHTPSLAAATSTDPNIESITAQLSGGQKYLQTSPEHFMKRLLAAGYPDIYQICRVYRDGEMGRTHLPEFTMIEWYRLGFGLHEIMQETTRLVSELLSRKLLAHPPIMLTYTEAFQDALSLDPLRSSVKTIAKTLGADAQLSRSLGDDRDGWLDLAMSTRVAGSFADDRLTVVYHYPASQAALARLYPDDTRFAERFELYFGELELANGFVELTDATEQSNRFSADREKRRVNGQKDYAPDHALIEALEAGMPVAAGVALGLDRLLMIDQGASDIRSITTFTPGT